MDNGAVHLALLVCPAIALLIVCLAIPLAMGKIKRNPWYGFRTPRTLSSDEIWYSANRSAAVNMIVAGILIWVVAALLYVMKDQMPSQTVVIVMAGFTFAAMVFAVVKSFMSLSKS